MGFLVFFRFLCPISCTNAARKEQEPAVSMSKAVLGTSDAEEKKHDR
jgi:hypothetical protein